MAKRMILVAAAWLVVVLAAPVWAAEQKNAPETTYYALYLQGSKIGYEKDVRTVADGKVTSSTMMVLSLNRMGLTMEISVLGTDVETTAGKPLSFEMTQKMSGMNMTTSGAVDEKGQLTVTSDTGGLAAAKKTETKAYPAGALLTEGQRLLTRKKGLAAGTKYEFLAFNPENQQGDRAEVTVSGTETIVLNGRKVVATKFLLVLHQGGSEMPTTEWVDGECETLRSEVSLVGMPLVQERCDAAYALSPAKNPLDFCSALLLTSPQPIPAGAKKVALTVKGKDGKKPAIMETDVQKVKANEDGTVTITVETLSLPKGEARPYAGRDKAALEALKPARYVQSEDEMIVKQAAQIVGSSKDAGESALKLAAWVHNMTEGDLSVGNASASEVIRNHGGDCKAFSVLLTALCRAAGIPARTADGYEYAAEFMGHQNVFGGHQWTQVFVGGKWIDLDATLASPYNSAGRITLGVGLGNEDDMLGLANLLGTFTITNVTTEPTAPAKAVPAKP